MSCLLLRLEGPLQSWGYRSRFSDRDTGLEPSKSGVVGLLCCALGRDRSESPADLAGLTMHVRVDHEGALLNDFHTAGGGLFRGSRGYFAPKSSGGPGKNPVVTNRYYLQDASFLVALGGEAHLLDKLAASVSDPAWPLTLGRRSCPPSRPVLVGRREQAPIEALKKEPYIIPQERLARVWNEGGHQFEPDLRERRIRLVLECGPQDAGAVMRRDVPVVWSDSLSREYTVRFVREESVTMTPEIELAHLEEVTLS